MSEYICSGCGEVIPAGKARIECQICHAYNSCSNCAILGEASGDHSARHPTTLIRLSGVNNILPLSKNGSSHHSSASRQRPWQTSFPPLPTRSLSCQAHQKPYQLHDPAECRQYQPTNAIAETPLPAQESSTELGGWLPFFNSDWTPSPTYAALMREVFHFLDSSHCGCLTPEAYTAFQEAQGCPLEHNVWKNAYINAKSANKEEAADAVLLVTFQTYSVDHTLLQRPPKPPSTTIPSRSTLRTAFTNVFGLAGLCPLSAPMPCLTLKGFIDICAFDALNDPDQAWHDLNRMLRFYQLDIWKRRGDIPRCSLPDEPVEGAANENSRLGSEGMGAVEMTKKHQPKESCPVVSTVDGDMGYECRF